MQMVFPTRAKYPKSCRVTWCEEGVELESVWVELTLRAVELAVKISSTVPPIGICFFECPWM